MACPKLEKLWPSGVVGAAIFLMGSILYISGRQASATAARLRPEQDFALLTQKATILQYRHWCTHKPQACHLHVRYRLENRSMQYNNYDMQDKWAAYHFPHFHVGQKIDCWAPVAPLSGQDFSDYLCSNEDCIVIQDPSYAVQYWMSEYHRLADPGLGCLYVSAALSLLGFASLLSIWCRRYSRQRGLELADAQAQTSLATSAE
eukprot:TRINITY_DN5833_c1_g1_i1.p1 TRINITY_DN5833_c1_g1~~TRINITY_DN5833_c1_g1_i1.p1  ORF type:complete len:204 (-),score=0.52 TRINITY_DN5833_c1_g1_i1:406-1017(-)